MSPITGHRFRPVAVSSTVAATGALIAAATLAIGAGWDVGTALTSFMITNAVMGFGFTICGAILAWHRSGNPIGWLFLGAAVAQSATAMAAPLAAVLHDHGAPQQLVRATLTIFAWSWPWSIGLFLILVLLLFPDGQLPSRRWRPVLVAIIVTSPLFALEVGSGPDTSPNGYPPGYVVLQSHDRLAPLWTISEFRGVACYLAALAALAIRYRRGDERTRRQLLWLLLALLIMFAALIPWAFIAGTPVVVLFSIPLVPAAIVIAIVRYRLLDIRLVVSRLLAWLVMSAVLLASYLGLVAVLDRFVAARLGRSAVVTVILVLLAALVLPRLQRLVDRLLYGDRDNPSGVVTRVGEQLTDSHGGLDEVASAIRTALRLPYVGIGPTAGSDAVAIGESGDQTAVVDRRALTYDAEQVGELIIGLRPGERQLSGSDRRVLTALSAPLALALHASALTEQVRASRTRIVAAREEERRRLRRELHDGLGPVLTGIAYTADAAANLSTSGPDPRTELILAISREAHTAIDDIRRLVEGLRPPALDELGLYEAIRARAGQLNRRADSMIRIDLKLPEDEPRLSAAAEVAVFRIVSASRS